MAKSNVTGLKGVLKGLNERLKKDARNAQRGLLEAGRELERDSKEIVPVDLGPLKASGSTKAEGRGFERKVTVQYEAAYAVYVHENPNAAHGAEFNRESKEGRSDERKATLAEARGKRKKPVKGQKKEKQTTARIKKKGKVIQKNRGPNQQYKFLERPARENRKKYIDKVREEMRKK